MILGKLIDKFRSSREDEELADYVDRLMEGGDTAGAPEHARDEAEEMARTAMLLRQVEQAPAPRSFALGPEYARAPQKQSWLSRLSAPQAPAMAAAAAVLALAVVVSGDMGGYLQDQDAAGQPALQQDETQQAPEDEPGDVAMLGNTATPGPEMASESTGDGVTAEPEGQESNAERAEPGVADVGEGSASIMSAPESTAEPDVAATPTDQQATEATQDPDVASRAFGLTAEPDTPEPPTLSKREPTPEGAPSQTQTMEEAARAPAASDDGDTHVSEAPNDGSDAYTLPLTEIKVGLGALAVALGALSLFMLRRP